MSKYKMDDDTVVDTDKAVETWEEATDWNGNNHISRATGSQWHHETLHLSQKGRYYLEKTSNYQGVLPSAAWISKEDAARWLLLMEEELPEDLGKLAEEVSE